MPPIDYKIFVPRGENNYVRFPNGQEIIINEILSINIFLKDDKITYWIYIKIDEKDLFHKTLLKKNNEPKMALLIGNNPYEVHGQAKVMEVSYHKWEEKYEITIFFNVVNASNTVNNPRKEIHPSRSELLELE
jgi:hypothetical protein